jgi:geranylgeranyl diphosphate synthase type I
MRRPVEPKLLSRYRPMIVDGLRSALSGGAQLREVLRYHVGLEDESGAPAEVFGKLIRPAIILFIVEELGGDPEFALSAAAALELAHEFSLIHDDVQDGDDTRRGRPTVWSRWGESQAINAGDLMLALALVEAQKLGDAVLGRLLNAVIEMIEGQALDLSFEARWPSMDEYTAMIDRKTGALFRCTWELGAILAGARQETRDRLNKIGRELGRAVQIRDDLLGIWGSESELGKPIGADLRRRKKSYPVVAAAEAVDDGGRRILEAAFAMETLSDGALSEVVEMMERLGVRQNGAHEVNVHLEEVLSELERLPVSEDGMQQMREACESLRWTPERGAR